MGNGFNWPFELSQKVETAQDQSPIPGSFPNEDSHSQIVAAYKLD